MLTNADLSQGLFNVLTKMGVEAIVVCAGARNAPLVVALSETESPKFKIFNFFEERSAAFFALGLIKAHNKPVAVMTTSGTAVAELLPATIEAYYQSLPLILISADRPKSYRGSGAPQTIDQKNIFSSFVEQVYDLDVQSTEVHFSWSRAKPLHLNICFDEPLFDQRSTVSPVFSYIPKMNSEERVPELNKNQKPLLILGELSPDEAVFVENALGKLTFPVYSESLSQLRNKNSINNDKAVEKLFSEKWCDSVIRIGGVPTLRFWRDLEEKYKDVPVINFSDRPFTGLAKKSDLYPLKSLPVLQSLQSQNLPPVFIEIEKKLSTKKEELLHEFKNSEPSFVRELSMAIGETPVYIGNSLPIRNWDQFAVVAKNEIYANRGANGIDGQISTYLGWSQKHDKSFCFIGDLTALYDLAALGLTLQLKPNKRTIVILNNFGGRIFERVFKSGDFVNEHRTQFEHWAQMWGWSYTKIIEAGEIKNLNQFSGQTNIVELQPDLAAGEKFWKLWDETCRSI